MPHPAYQNTDWDCGKVITSGIRFLMKVSREDLKPEG